MPNYQLQIVGDEFVISIGHDDKFYVNLLFDRSIYRPMCTHMGNFCDCISNSSFTECDNCSYIIFVPHITLIAYAYGPATYRTEGVERRFVQYKLELWSVKAKP